jgi:spore coat protein CotH
LIRTLIILLIALGFYSCETITDNNPVNDLEGLTVIKLIAADDDLERLFNNRFSDLEIPVKINYQGNILTGTLRAAGAGSRYYPKFGFRVKLKDSSINGLSEFSLSSQPADVTYIKTAVAADLYKAVNIPVFYSEPVFVTLNNENYGVYNLVERLDYNFFYRRNLSIGELYKVNFDSRFSFSSENRLEATFEKEIPDDDNFSSLAEFITALDQTEPEDIQSEIGSYMDIENYLWYHAVSSIRSDPDSYTNNFYLYKSSVEVPFNFLPWDFDRTFTGKIGLYGDNEIVRSLFRDNDVFESYKNKVRFILENYFTESRLYPLIDGLYSKLHEYYKYDPFLAQKNMQQEIEYLKNYIKQRREELLELLTHAEN